MSLFVYILFHGLTHATDSLVQVVVPGATQLQLHRGLYTVFLEEESVVNGKIYSTTQSVDGLVCQVNFSQTGSPVAVRRPGMSTTYSVGGRSGHSVLEFPIQEDGKYAFSCGYGENASGPEVVVAVGSGVGEAILRTILDGFLTFFGSGIAGLVPVLIVLIMRARSKKQLHLSQTK